MMEQFKPFDDISNLSEKVDNVFVFEVSYDLMLDVLNLNDFVVNLVQRNVGKRSNFKLERNSG